MTKKQTPMQKLKNWWYNLSHKRFLLFQLIILCLSIYVLDCRSASDEGCFFTSLFLSLFYIIIQLAFITFFYGIKKLALHLVLIWGLYELFYHIFGYATSVIWFLLYTTFSLILQYSHKKYLNYIIVFSILFLGCFFVSNTCVCKTDPLCQTSKYLAQKYEPCMHTVLWKTGNIKIPLFQITDKNILRKIMRTEPW